MTESSLFFTALVASHLPPRPVSRMTISQPSSLKQRSAAAVSISKAVGMKGARPSSFRLACSFSMVLRTIVKYLATRPPTSGEPLSKNLSLYSNTEGELKVPVLRQAETHTAVIYAVTEPFPLVPATWTILRFSSGEPKRSSSSLSLSRPKSVPALSMFEIQLIASL